MTKYRRFDGTFRLPFKEQLSNKDYLAFTVKFPDDRFLRDFEWNTGIDMHYSSNPTVISGGFMGGEFIVQFKRFDKPVVFNKIGRPCDFNYYWKVLYRRKGELLYDDRIIFEKGRNNLYESIRKLRDLLHLVYTGNLSCTSAYENEYAIIETPLERLERHKKLNIGIDIFI